MADDGERSEISKAVPISRRALKSAFAGQLPEITSEIQASWNHYRAVRTSAETFADVHERTAALVESAGAFKQPGVLKVAEQLLEHTAPIYEDGRHPDAGETVTIDRIVLRLFREAASLSERPTVLEFDALKPIE